MSSVAVAGHVRITGAPPRERMHSLLTVPNVLVPQDELESHWQSGVVIDGYPDEVPELWEGCSEGTFRTKNEGSPTPIAQFTAFNLYVSINCSGLGIGNPERFAERAAAVLRATQAHGVEEALSQGIVGLDNPYLGDVNLDILGAGAVSAQVGLSYLEEAIGATGRQGIIHITPPVAAALAPLVARDDEPSRPVYTTAGTPLAIGSGYQGTDPVSGSTPAAGQSWIFATGPVEVRIDDTVELVPDDIASALDRTLNDVVYRAEKTAVVSWDTALQSGVLVDWSP
jgi:hypothetical protein